MARIEFKGKIKTQRYTDNSVAYEYIHVPTFTTKHCDMSAFRSHSKYGPYANSSLFMQMLAGIRKKIFGGDKLKLNNVPEGVSIDTTGFLAVVSFEV